MKLKYRLLNVYWKALELRDVSLYYLSYLVPRRKNKWIFAGGENSKYFFVALQDRVVPQQTFLILNNKDEAERMGRLYKNVIYRRTWKARYHLYTASAYIVNTILGEINFTSAGPVKKINLWHGVGIKRMGLTNLYDDEDRYYKISGLKRYFSQPYLSITRDMILSPSPMMANHFAASFGVDECRCLRSAYPRCDFMLKPQEEIVAYLEGIGDERSLALIAKMKKYRRTLLYTPTWRDSGADILGGAGFDFARLNSVLVQKDCLFLMKLHPRTPFDASILAQYGNIVSVDRGQDLYPIMPFTSMLITDYSSIYYDYMLLDKEILLFPFDEEEYVSQSRDFAFDFREYTPGPRVYTFGELLDVIEGDKPCRLSSAERSFVREKFWKWNNDLYSEICAKF